MWRKSVSPDPSLLSNTKPTGAERTAAAGMRRDSPVRINKFETRPTKQRQYPFPPLVVSLPGMIIKHLQSESQILTHMLSLETRSRVLLGSHEARMKHRILYWRGPGRSGRRSFDRNSGCACPLMQFCREIHILWIARRHLHFSP